MCVCVCVCVCARARVCVCLCVHACIRVFLLLKAIEQHIQWCQSWERKTKHQSPTGFSAFYHN